jgi:hypothetical protein
VEKVETLDKLKIMEFDSLTHVEDNQFSSGGLFDRQNGEKSSLK